MNKYGTFLAGSALLATTALASGTVQAASVATSNGAANGAISALSAYKIGTSLFSTATSSAVNISAASFEIRTTISYTTQATRAVILINGAEFDAGATAPTVSLGTIDGGSSLTNLSAAGTANVTIFTDRLIVGALTSTFQIIHVSNPNVKNLQALGTTGQTVTINGRIENPSVSATYENIDTGTLFTSVTSGAIVFTTAASANGMPAASNSQASVTVSPPFTAFGSSAGTAILTATVGTVSMTTYGALSTNLASTLSGAALISTAELRITHGALSDPAFNSLSIRTAANIQTKTISQIASGIATFSLTGVSIGDTAASAIIIDIGVTGSTAVTGGLGTGAVTVTATATSLGNLGTTTGNLISITKGGLTSSVNTFQNSFNSVPSFLRITNSGTVAGTYTVTIRNGDAASGAIMGTYTGGTVQPNGTVQLSAANLELGAALAAPTSLGNYTLSVAAAFNGYIQHLTYSNSTGVLSNLSAFRQGGSIASTSQVAP